MSGDYLAVLPSHYYMPEPKQLYPEISNLPAAKIGKCESLLIYTLFNEGFCRCLGNKIKWRYQSQDGFKLLSQLLLKGDIFQSPYMFIQVCHSKR
jgi:hypothetical protein